MRLRDIPLSSSAIRELTILSRQLGAVNLSQGFADEDTWPEIKQFAGRAIQESTHQYTDPRGEPGLREQIALACSRQFGWEVDREQHVVVTCGATEAMIVSLEALLPERSEVILFTPFYENYFLQTLISNMRARYVDLREPSFEFDRGDLEGACSPATAALILCNPCNPTGKVFTRRELETILEFAIEHDLLVFVDETYHHFIWDGATHISLASLPGARDRVITIVSMGKTYSVTGWRVGYLIAPAPLVAQLSAVHDFHTITAPHPLQVALANAMRELDASFYEKVRREFLFRRELLAGSLRECGFSFTDPQGSYFLWCSYSAMASTPDVAFSQWLLHRGGIAGLPGSVFYPKGARDTQRIRFTFSKSRATLEAAKERLSRLRINESI
ncbi:MAG TPA: pyridoxal phosphate-dependent aminotransferase [Verrucomicrobiae bacterium]|nr:pyridoxal phosphate-dependent aminotransferase [Verrucomicrobiae bacterium]